MSKQQEYKKLENLVLWIDQNTSGIAITGHDEKEGIAMGCLDLAIEHQAAISKLFSLGLVSSAFALIRVLAESAVKGWWFLRCATPIDVDKYKNKRDLPSFGEMIDSIEKAIGEDNGVLKGFKQSSWSALNDFTHSGIIQVSNRFNEGKLEVAYTDAQIISAVDISCSLGLIASMLLNVMSNKKDEYQKFIDKMTEYANK